MEYKIDEGQDVQTCDSWEEVMDVLTDSPLHWVDSGGFQQNLPVDRDQIDSRSCDGVRYECLIGYETDRENDYEIVCRVMEHRDIE